PARLHLACPPLGDRVQVPAGGGDDEAPRHPGQRGAHGPGDAVRPHGAGQGRRVDGAARHAAQRRRGGAQGRADRRHDRDPQGRRRHPRGPRPGRRRPRRLRARVRHALALPRVRHRAAAGEGGRRRHPLPQRPVLPGPVARAGVPRRRPRRVRHREPRLRGRHRAAAEPPPAGRGRRLLPRPRAAAALVVLHEEGRHAQRQRREAPRQPAEPQGRPAVAGPGGSLDPARGPDRRPGARPRLPVARPDHGGLGGGARRGRRCRAHDRAVGARLVRGRLAPRRGREVAPGRGAHGRRGRRRRSRPPHRRHRRRHRIAAGLQPGPGDRGDPGARRQGDRLGVEEDRLRRGGGRSRQQVRQGRAGEGAGAGRRRLRGAAGRRARGRARGGDRRRRLGGRLRGRL
ncbi:MAG: DNA ligase (NAD(+)), partial [uncultured Blastococcus sp.]